MTHCTLVDSVLVVKPVSADKLVVHAFLIWHVRGSTLPSLMPISNGAPDYALPDVCMS